MGKPKRLLTHTNHQPALSSSRHNTRVTLAFSLTYATVYDLSWIGWLKNDTIFCDYTTGCPQKTLLSKIVTLILKDKKIYIRNLHRSFRESFQIHSTLIR